MTHKGTCKGLLHVVLTGDAMSKCIRTCEPFPNFLPILERSETWEDQNLLQEFTSYTIKHSECLRITINYQHIPRYMALFNCFSLTPPAHLDWWNLIFGGENPLVLLGNLGHRWSGTIYHQPSCNTNASKREESIKAPSKENVFRQKRNLHGIHFVYFLVFWHIHTYIGKILHFKKPAEKCKEKMTKHLKVWIHLCILSLYPFPKTRWKGGVTFQPASPDRWPASRVEQGLDERVSRESLGDGNSNMCYFQSYLEEWSNFTFSNGLKPPNWFLIVFVRWRWVFKFLG